MSQTGGDKELVIGNKQIISLFFVVVALCGVFFAMGYMVRGNSLKGTVSTTGDDSSAVQASTVRRQQPEPPRETAETPPDDASSPTETHPVTDNPKPEPLAETKLATPEAGATYVQVVALGRSDADSTAKSLREQHLPALVVASPKEGLFRVWVGPYHETADVADAKVRLKALGFSETIVQKQ